MTADRRTRVAQSATQLAARNGIDFVAVDVGQLEIDVHFLNTVELTNTGPLAVTITDGDVIPTVVVTSTAYMPGNPVTGVKPRLRIKVQAPGDFSHYTLTLASPELDPYVASVKFSFKTNCETGFDCRAPRSGPDAQLAEVPLIDYLAKDFQSFRQALLDFSAGRYPGWQERSPADFGVMMLEALCAVADDLSYLQDRVHNEPFIDSATERLSVTRLARLVDYDTRPATAARVWLRFDVDVDTAVTDGFTLTAQTPESRGITFEVGRGMIDPRTGLQRDRATFPLLQARNELTPYLWDAADECLRAGSMEVYVQGQGYGFVGGERLLIETKAEVAGNAPSREWVVLSKPRPGDEIDDPLPEGGAPAIGVTRLRFDVPTQFDHDLSMKVLNGALVPMTALHGNVVPATQGRTVRGESFAIPGDTTPASARQAIWRTGPRDDDGRVADQFLYTLDTEARLAWLTPEDGGRAAPEIALIEQDADQTVWVWRKWLLAAKRFEKAYMLDPARYRRVTTDPGQPVSHEYVGDGDTIRFGFQGLCDVPSENSRFELTYRIADGSAGNVARDTITQFDTTAVAGVKRVTNPFPATGGDDAETLTHVRDHAPQKFRVEQLRAVRPEDYRRAAEDLPWVQRAGATFRWTGSWLTGFVAVDPVDGREPPLNQTLELTELLNRRRLAGYEVFVAAPRYVSLDIHLEVCARPDAYAGHVAEAVRRAVASTPGAFFDPNNFTFGESLRRSSLEGAVQRAAGVGGVVCIRLRRRGQTAYVEMPETVAVGASEILQVASDANRPDRGRVDIVVRGGR